MATRTKDAAPTGFKFTPENMEKAKYHMSKYPEGRQASAVIPLLDIAQRQNNGWVSHECMEEVARILDMPFIRVNEVATFYTMFNLKPVGKFHLQLCGTTPCMLRGAEDLKQVCKKKLGLRGGDVTADGKFSLIEVECLGACVNAPVVQINDDFFEDLTPENFEKVIDCLSNDNPVHTGSQIGRQCSAPEGYGTGGKTSKTVASSKAPSKAEKAPTKSSSKPKTKGKVTDAE